MVRPGAARGAPVATQGHNDLGRAVANTLAGVAAGATMFHGCLNGLGERAGNAALEEVVLALKCLYGRDCGINTELFYGASRLVERLSGIGVAPNKAVVGLNAFSHESGIHAAGVVRNHATFEPGLMTPEMVGHRRRLVMGKHTGRHGIVEALRQAGISPPEELEEIVRGSGR